VKLNLKSLSLNELEKIILDLGESKYRAKQIYTAIYGQRVKKISAITTLSKSLVASLEEKYTLDFIQVNKHLVSKDGTQKFTFFVEEGKEVEAVWIPSGDDGRKTICISSQVGCTLSCKFCATGRLDFKGNLKTNQILDQVLLVEEIVGDRATNIVFMGMGEPMHNYNSVIKAAHILHDPDAFNLGAKRITISTAGVISGIEKFIEENQPFNFAISLNHANESQRKTIMNVDEKYPLKDLLVTARKFTKTLGRRITFEYVMIPEINMGTENAKRLVKIARSVNCKINLIPINTDFHGWRRPTEKEIDEFKELVKEAKVPVMNRRSPGKEINGACGMLALKG
jgi:23S rRNA (adenine2503-C2)-methyltransferase